MFDTGRCIPAVTLKKVSDAVAFLSSLKYNWRVGAGCAKAANAQLCKPKGCSPKRSWGFLLNPGRSDPEEVGGTRTCAW